MVSELVQNIELVAMCSSRASCTIPGSYIASPVVYAYIASVYGTQLATRSACAHVHILI